MVCYPRSVDKKPVGAPHIKYLASVTVIHDLAVLA
jgi:hypothetical protein